MIKRAAVYWLPDDVNEDDFWKYHTETHAPDVINIAGDALKKYTISRIVKTVHGDKPPFFAIIEMWWESEEAMTKAMELVKNTKLPSGKTIWDDFWDQVAGGYAMVTDEFIAK